MALITLHRRQRFKLAIPYWIMVNDTPVGLMRTGEVSLSVPTGTYRVQVKVLFRVWKWLWGVGGSREVSIAEGQHLHYTITDRERWWNILFNIDLVVWLASFFFTLPAPWDVVYHIVSEGFFALWLLRIIIIHNRYFVIK